MCLLIEIIRSTNEIMMYYKSNAYFYEKNDINCKIIEYFIESFHLISTWLICAFSIERCIAINSPLLLRKFSNLKKTKLICLSIFVFAMIFQIINLFIIKNNCICHSSNGNNFLIKVHSYFHQLICSVILPSLMYNLN